MCDSSAAVLELLDGLRRSAGLPLVPLFGDPDDVPAPPPVPRTRPGDVWILGDHRLACGDATDRADIDRAMDGARADLVWADPPYGVDYVGKTRDALTIAGVDMRATLEGTAAELREFFGRELPEGTGTELLIPTLVEELQGVTGTARKALRFICEHAPEVGFDAVASYMGVDTRVLSGYMSSIGRRAPSLSTRFKRDYDKRVYRVPPESAGTILKAPVNIGASQSSGPLLVSLQGDHRSADKGDMGDKDTALLTLVCPHCGEAFPSMMQIDRATFATIRLKSVLEHCSACGKAARFEKGDYFFVAGERHS